MGWWSYPIKPNEVRDWLNVAPLSANATIFCWETYGVVGLDLLIHNRGASSLTVRIDDGGTKTVLAGDAYSLNNVKFDKVAVTSTVAYDRVIAGKAVKEMKGKDGDRIR